MAPATDGLESIDLDECIDTNAPVSSEERITQLRQGMPDKDKEIEKKNNDIRKKDEKIEELEASVLKLKVKLTKTPINNHVPEMRSCSQVTPN